MLLHVASLCYILAQSHCLVLCTGSQDPKISLTATFSGSSEATLMHYVGERSNNIS